jgi:uncharacterized protein
MDITPLVREGQKIVQSYDGGVFRISGENYHTPILLSPGRVEPWNISRPINELSAEDFDPLIRQAADFDVFLLGCGRTMVFLPTDMKHALKRQGLSFDVMDSGAACRTYNVLMAEGRRVLAALLPY